jgi:hypothetical protein
VKINTSQTGEDKFIIKYQNFATNLNVKLNRGKRGKHGKNATLQIRPLERSEKDSVLPRRNSGRTAEPQLCRKEHRAPEAKLGKRNSGFL